MPEQPILAEADAADFESACRLLMSASCCIGLRDDVAQELVHDVLKLLHRVARRNPPDLDLTAAPVGGVH